MRIIALVLALVFAFSGCGRVEPTIFTFDDTEVSIKEFNFFYKQLVLQQEQTMTEEEAKDYWKTEEGKKKHEEIKETAYNELMNLYISGKKAEASGFSYNNEVLQMASTIKNQFTGGNLQSFYELVDTDAVSLDRITRLYAIREALCQLLIEDGVIDLSEESIKANFENLYFKAQHILVLTTDDMGNLLDDKAKAEKKALAESILARANKGEDFTKLANELSEDPGQETNPDGYVFTDGEMVIEFEDAVKALELNAISGIVETSYGYHIIKRLPLSFEKDSGAAENLDQVISSKLITDYLDAYVSEWKNDFNIVENKDVLNNLKI